MVKEEDSDDSIMQELEKVSMINIDYSEEALNQDIFSCTFYSLIKEYKDEYCILLEDQA